MSGVQTNKKKILLTNINSVGTIIRTAMSRPLFLEMVSDLSFRLLFKGRWLASGFKLSFKDAVPFSIFFARLPAAVAALLSVWL